MVKDRLRNYFHNPGFQNWNIGSVQGVRRHRTAQRVLLRAEAFNWLNHPNLSGFGSNPRSCTFGKVTGKSSERNLQLSLRYSF